LINLIESKIAARSFSFELPKFINLVLVFVIWFIVINEIQIYFLKYLRGQVSWKFTERDKVFNFDSEGVLHPKIPNFY
jgi:hypothetical protein